MNDLQATTFFFFFFFLVAYSILRRISKAYLQNKCVIQQRDPSSYKNDHLHGQKANYYQKVMKPFPFEKASNKLNLLPFEI